jgi:hypothetical protein
MKVCFSKANVRTALWWTYSLGRFLRNSTDVETNVVSELPYPIIAKKLFGSRGEGNTKIDTAQQMQEFLLKHTRHSDFIFEVFHNFNREYRLHVNENGCFYTCRKMLKTDTPDDKKWFRNDKNSVWIVEENPIKDISYISYKNKKGTYVPFLLVKNIYKILIFI